MLVPEHISYADPRLAVLSDETPDLHREARDRRSRSRRRRPRRRPPDGSPNFFRDFARPVPCGDVARLAVKTLVDREGFRRGDPAPERVEFGPLL